MAKRNVVQSIAEQGSLGEAFQRRVEQIVDELFLVLPRAICERYPRVDINEAGRAVSVLRDDLRALVEAAVEHVRSLPGEERVTQRAASAMIDARKAEDAVLSEFEKRELEMLARSHVRAVCFTSA